MTKSLTKNLRDKVIKHYFGSCASCGTSEKINIHHKDRDRTNNVLSNLSVLCRDCHLKIHDRGYSDDPEAGSKIEMLRRSEYGATLISWLTGISRSKVYNYIKKVEAVENFRF